MEEKSIGENVINVLYNIRGLKKSWGGVYQYSMALAKILAQESVEESIYIYSDDPDSDFLELIEKVPKFHHIYPDLPWSIRLKNFVHRILNFFLRKMGASHTFKITNRLDHTVNKYRIDIMHTPFQSILKSKGIPTISTMHDVQELHFPEFFSSSERANRAVNYKKAIDGADAVIVSYEHIKKDIIRYFDKPENQVHTILLDMQDLWFENFLNTEVGDSKKRKLPDRFILYPAATWEHKNHIHLLKALKLIVDEKKLDIHLVCTGHKTKFFTDTIQPLIKSLNLEKHVQFKGIVTDGQLFSYYQQARGVVAPTLYEAGSFPLMESIMMNVPVICSNVTSLPETIGNEKFTFDPLDIQEMSDKIVKLWEDEAFRSELMSLLPIKANRLKFNDAAQKIRHVYSTLYNSKQQQPGDYN